jgi:tRNA(Ile)-lysidine synthase
MISSVDQALAGFAPKLPLAVAYSGGADSTALLLACARRWPTQVSAFHVHHGLQAAADDFELHCHNTCAALAVPFYAQRVDARHAPGESPEAAARQARYLAFESLLRAVPGSTPIQSMALGQHADDQVETLLLALSRGAGLAGLSAMPACWQRGAVTYYRPLLGLSSVAIRDWLRQQDMPWIEDPSNQDERYTRNRIRAHIMPALQACFPQFRETFTRSSAHAAQAQLLLDEVAAQDLAQVGTPPVITSLQALSAARQANVLRHWLRITHQTTASTAQLQELMRQIAACQTRGHHMRIKVGQGFCVRLGGVLDWYNPALSQPPQDPYSWL